MSIIRTSQNKKKGMTTIFGTLIFISIFFSAVIPLQLSMLQIDTMEATIIEELDREGLDKLAEDLTVVAYPTTTTSDSLKIRVQNNGIVDVNLTRVWIKDTIFKINQSVGHGESEVVGPFSITLDTNSSYPVKVITERGNVYGSSAGNLIYSSSGVWFTPSLGINVYIENDKGKYYIEVSNSTWSETYTTKGQDFGDVIVLFEVDSIDTYHVVCKKNSSSGPNLPGTPVDIPIIWPNGSPIIFVFTTGMDV